MAPIRKENLATEHSRQLRRGRQGRPICDRRPTATAGPQSRHRGDRGSDVLAGWSLSPRPFTEDDIALLIGLLRKAFDEAIIEGIIQVNPAKHVRKPAQTHQEMKTWTAAQLKTFLDAAREDDLAGAWALSVLGLRRGEVLGIRWSDIDFTTRQIHIRQARVQTGNVVVTGAPKTARGRRTLPLNDLAIEMLRHTKSRTFIDRDVIPLRQRGTDGDRLVVVDAQGEPLSRRSYRQFARLSKRAGLPSIRLHDVRHSVLSLMLENGVSVPVVAKVAGHDPAITLRVYAHAQEEASRRAVDALGALFSGSEVMVSGTFSADWAHLVTRPPIAECDRGLNSRGNTRK